MQLVRSARISGRLWKRHPDATCTSSRPRPIQSCCKASGRKVLQRIRAQITVRNDARNSRSDKGCCAPIKAVS